MGYKTGEGLGVNSQGVVQPVAVSKQKQRRGLGLASMSTAAEPGVLYKSADPKLVWSEQDCAPAQADGDLVWRWQSHERPISLTPLLLDPDDADALGPPIRTMLHQDKFCSPILLREMLSYKVGAVCLSWGGFVCRFRVRLGIYLCVLALMIYLHLIMV